ncbi:hypothetical protein ACQEU6_01115 [Spirillospora sp. CA-108201]
MKKLAVITATGALGATLVAGGAWAAGSDDQPSPAGRVSAEKGLITATGTAESPEATGANRTASEKPSEPNLQGGAKAAKAPARYTFKWVERTFSFTPLHTFHSITVRARVKYNTKKVYVVDGPYCRKNRQISPVKVTQTWCGTANNGGGDRGYLSTGVNFTVFAGAQVSNFPAGFETEEYGRIKVTRFGHATYEGGGN